MTLDLVQRLCAAVEDPMWADHCELSKKTVRDAIEELEQLRKIAARYDWLVRNCARADPKMDGRHLWFGSIRPMKGVTFDEALDTVMMEEAKREAGQ